LINWLLDPDPESAFVMPVRIQKGCFKTDLFGTESENLENTGAQKKAVEVDGEEGAGMDSCSEEEDKAFTTGTPSFYP